METFKVIFPAFCFVLLAGCSAQGGLSNATCAALGELIENGNADIVRGYMIDMACNYITCSIEDVGNINISFTTCRRPFQVSAVISNISNTGRSRRSRALITFTITDTVFLDITVDRISNGVNFGVRLC